jgi:hypothetical protein
MGFLNEFKAFYINGGAISPNYNASTAPPFRVASMAIGRDITSQYQSANSMVSGLITIVQLSPQPVTDLQHRTWFESVTTALTDSQPAASILLETRRRQGSTVTIAELVATPNSWCQRRLHNETRSECIWEVFVFDGVMIMLHYQVPQLRARTSNFSG